MKGRRSIQLFFILFLLFCKNIIVVLAWNRYEQLIRPSNGQNEWKLHVEHLLTMSAIREHDELSVHDFIPQTMAWLERDKDQLKGCLDNKTVLAYSAANQRQWASLTERALPGLIQFHGRHQRLWGVNGQIPGPILVFRHGSEVELRLKNGLLLDSLGVHLHGMLLPQWHNGGVAPLQQCPVAVLSDNLFRFRAHPPGTHWYHGQFPSGHQSNGFLGAVVVLPEGGIKEDRDFVAILQDWPLVGTNEQEENWSMGMEEEGDYDGTNGGDGVWSILVNQKGWHDRDQISARPSSIPWSRFPVGKDEQIRLRLIHGGYRHPLAVHIEAHQMEVVAADGTDLEPKKVDALILYPGERLDVRLHTLARPAHSLYRIVIGLAEQFLSGAPQRPIYGLAELEYDANGQRNGKEEKADFRLSKCGSTGANRPCALLGCPFEMNKNGKGGNDGEGDGVFRTSDGRQFECIPLDGLERSAEKEEEEEEENAQQQRNVGMTTNSDTSLFVEKHVISIDPVHKLVDGFRFQMPNSSTSFAPFFLAPDDAIRANNCSACVQRECECFYFKRFGLGKSIQITFVHKGAEIGGNNVSEAGLATLFRQSFALHLHGVKFELLKIGLPTISANGIAVEPNADLLKCKSGAGCDHFAMNYGKNKRPRGLPVLKDTVLVPFGGYTVIRFRAENPGWWLAETQQNGRGSVRFAFAIGEDEEMPKPPMGFPTDCGTFEPGVGIYEQFL